MWHPLPLVIVNFFSRSCLQRKAPDLNIYQRTEVKKLPGRESNLSPCLPPLHAGEGRDRQWWCLVLEGPWAGEGCKHFIRAEAAFLIALELREPQLSPLAFQGENTHNPAAEEPLGVAGLSKQDNTYFPKLKLPFLQMTDWTRGYGFSAPSRRN